MVEPSIVKNQRPEPGCMTKEEVYRTKKQRGEAGGLRTRNKNERMRGTMDAGEDGR